MSDALENKAVEILDKSQAAIGQFADKLGEMAKQYGPDVADAALQMARVDAIDSLVAPITCLLILIVTGAYGMPKMWAWARQKNAALKAEHDYDQGAPIFFSILATVAYAISTFAALANTLNVWAWIGIFEPKLWLAKRILGL